MADRVLAAYVAERRPAHLSLHYKLPREIQSLDEHKKQGCNKFSEFNFLVFGSIFSPFFSYLIWTCITILIIFLPSKLSDFFIVNTNNHIVHF